MFVYVFIHFSDKTLPFLVRGRRVNAYGMNESLFITHRSAHLKRIREYRKLSVVRSTWRKHVRPKSLEVSRRLYETRRQPCCHIRR